MNPLLPRAVDGVLWRALSKARGARFESVDAFAEALVAAASSENVALGSMATVEGPPIAQEARRAQRGSTRPGFGMRAVGALVALVALGTGGWWLARGHVPRLASGPAVATKGSAAHVGEPPFRPAFTGACDASTDPNVARLYAAAMQAVRDAAIGEAETSLSQIFEVSPGFAKAHLAWVLMSYYIDDDTRAHYRAAALHRTELDDHERELLSALEPLFAATPDVAATKARLRAAAERSPNDGDIAFQLAQAQWRAGELAAEEAALTELLRRDPRFAFARESLGECREYTGDKEGAIQAYRSCVDVAPSALACLIKLADVQAHEGMCVDAVATSRSAIAVAPTEPAPYDELATTLLGTGAAIESVRAAAEQGIVHIAPASQAESRATWRARVAAVTGDFDEALRATEEWTRAVADRTDAISHYMPVDFRARLLLEIGRTQEARSALEGFLRNAPAWGAHSYVIDDTIIASATLYRIGALSRAELATRRDAWLQGSAASAELPWMQSQQQWSFAYAVGAATPEDARAALEALPRFPALIPAPARDPSLDANDGEVYRRAGRAREGLPALRRNAASCSWGLDPFSYASGLNELGVALEEIGDSDGACSAYARVVGLWGTTKRRSTTGEKARSRFAALRCGR